MKLNVPFPAGIKDFMCELCGKTFSERNTMETHKLIHTGMWGSPGDRLASRPLWSLLGPSGCAGCGELGCEAPCGLFQNIWHYRALTVALCPLKFSHRTFKYSCSRCQTLIEAFLGGRRVFPRPGLGVGGCLGPRSRGCLPHHPLLSLPPRARGQWASSGHAPYATRSTSPSTCCRSMCSSPTTRWRRRAVSCVGPRCPPGPP